MIVDGGNIFMMYKNDPFYTFGNKFKGNNEVGDTINIDYLEIALEYPCDIAAVYQICR